MILRNIFFFFVKPLEVPPRLPRLLPLFSPAPPPSPPASIAHCPPRPRNNNNQQASHCKIKDLDGIRELAGCKALSCVDLQQNKIDGDPEEMIALFASMPALACLYMQGNPIVSTVRQYRKRMISSIPTLSYLDDRPVFPLERLCAEAWAEGGLEAEKAARKKYKDEEEAKQRRDHEYLSNMREEARARREQLAAEGKQAMLDVGMDSDGEWEPEEEPPELIAARARLAQFEARPGEEEPPELTKARTEAAATSGGGKETREWQPLDGSERGSGGCGPGPGACEPSSCAGCGPTTTTTTTTITTTGGESAKKAGRAAEEEEEEEDCETKENDEPAELNIEPLDIKFGSSVTIVKHDTTEEEALDELD